ncbi:hypothetical protein [Aquabacterium sp.]|uniref:hypothetical protein n=1 Tax=Aquabacterium sp. TaxID=1872578 RepID=UPI003D6D9D85
MSEGFKNHSYQAIERPFNTRILTPLVAAWLPGDTTDGFTAITFASFLVFMIAWYFISKELGFPIHVFGFLVAWFLIHPLGVQIYYSLRQLIDPMSYALMAIAIYFYLSSRHALFFVTMFISLLAKESFLFVLMVAVATEIYSSLRGHQEPKSAYRFTAYAILIYVSYQVAIYFCQQAFFPAADQTNIISTIRLWWRKVRHDPNRLIVWAGSFFCATGTLAALVFQKKPSPVSAIEFRQSFFLKLGACGFVALGLIGGSDMSRIIFNGIVFIFPALILQVNHSSKNHLTSLVYASSLLIATIYPLFFKTTFEYTYYFSNQIGSSLVFVLIVGFSILMIRRTTQSTLN